MRVVVVRGIRGVLGAVIIAVLMSIPAGSVAVARTEIMDLRPNGPRGAAKAPALKSVELVPVDPLLVEALRWTAPDGSRASCIEAAPRIAEHMARIKRVAMPPDISSFTPALIEQANKQLQTLDIQEAIDSLQEARLMLPCTGQAMTLEVLRRLFLYEAVAHVYAEDKKGQSAFLDMLAVDPRIMLEPGYPHKVENAFAEAVGKHTRRQALALDVSGLEGEVLLDGRPAASTLELLPGRHVLQLRGPEVAGVSRLRTALISVQPGKGPVKLAALAELRFPSAPLVKDELARGLESYRLDRFQIVGLEQYLAAKKQKRVTFAVKEGRTNEVVLREYNLGKGIEGAPEGEAGRVAEALKQATAPVVAAGAEPPGAGGEVSASGESTGTSGRATVKAGEASKADAAIDTTGQASATAATSKAGETGKAGEATAKSGDSGKAGEATAKRGDSGKAGEATAKSGDSGKAGQSTAKRGDSGKSGAATAKRGEVKPTESGKAVPAQNLEHSAGPVQEPPRAPRVAVRVGAGAQVLLGSAPVFTATAQGVGYMVQIEVPVSRLVIAVRGAGFPLGGGSSPTADACGAGFEGEGTATADQVTAAAACLHTGGPLSLGAGAGLPIALGGKLRLAPELFVDAVYLPGAVVADPALVGGQAVVDLLAAGPMLRARLDYVISRGRVRVDAGLELSGGAAVALVGEQLLLAVPVGAAVGVGMGF